MTPSPDLIHQLRASRPAAPAALRARVRELASERRAERSRSWPISVRRSLVIALPAAAALAIASAGVLGLARSDGGQEYAARDTATEKMTLESASPDQAPGNRTADGALGAVTGRAQRVSATLSVEVEDSNAVSSAAQDALDLTRSLGGYVVSSSVTTGEQGSATMTVRVPVGRVQEAFTGLSGLGRIVSQQVTIDDLQGSLDELTTREASVRGEIARLRARLESGTLDPEAEAVLRSRLQVLRSELRALRSSIAATNAEARMSTIQLAIVTTQSGAAAPPSRLDRTIDEALNVLAWEAVIALGIVIVLAPFALVALAAWLGRRLYRRHEDERLLAT